MTVGVLRSYLADLSRFVSATGAKGDLTDDLAAVLRGLAPFEAYSLKDFSGFLVDAEKFHSTGQLPITTAAKQPPPVVTSTGRGRAGTAPVDLESLKSSLHSFRMSAKSPEVTPALIEAKREVLQPLKKAQLIEVAGVVGIRVPSNKTNPEIIDAIIASIRAMGDEARRIKQ